MGGTLNAMSEQDSWRSAETYTWEQDVRRRDWPTQHTSRMPDPPWPCPDNPMLTALLHDARSNVAAGMTTDIAALRLATHCWFEGGIEGYDRGQLDARSGSNS
jgi:hypothetical protein